MTKKTKNLLNEDFQIVLDSIRKITRTLRLSSKEMEKTVGLSTAQIFVLQKLAKQNNLSVNELAKATFTHQSSVSVVISKLAERKLVERVESKTDARAVELRITPQGSYLLSKSPQSVQDRLYAGFSQMPVAQQKALVKSITSLIEKSGMQKEKAPMLLEEDSGD